MIRFLARWLSTALALWVAAYMLAGVTVSGWETLAISALVLGLVNATIRPVLRFLSFPITLLTLGLFALVVNGASFGVAAWLVPGFSVTNLGWAIVGAAVVSVVSTVISWVIEPGEKKKSKKMKRKG